MRPAATHRHVPLSAAALLLGALVLLSLAGTASAAVAGSLAPRVGSAACITGTPVAPCVDVNTFDGPGRPAVSPDGAHVYVAASTSNAIVLLDRDPATGALVQPVNGCVSSAGGGPGNCQAATGILGVGPVAVSPDGRNVYGVSSSFSTITVFDADPVSGALAQKAGSAGCITDVLSANPPCGTASALAGLRQVVVSPDGRNVYAVSPTSDAVAVFDRDAATGALTQKAATAGCISEGGSGGCAAGVALDQVTSLTVSPDGTSVYAVSGTNATIAVLDRDPATGALTQKAGTAGCLTSSVFPVLPCGSAVALSGVGGPVVSADGRSLYLASSSIDTITVFDRDPAAGALTQKAGTAGCISDTGDPPCQDGTALDGVRSLAVSPDGTSLYAAATTSSALVVFDRDAATGALTQKSGMAGCLMDVGGGVCQTGTALAGVSGVSVSPDGATVYASSSASDTVAILDRRQAPLCAPGASSVGHAQATTLQLACIGRGAPVTGYQVAQAPAVGTLGPVDALLGRLTYTPPGGFSGPASFTYTATSLYGTSQPAPFALTVQPALTGPSGAAGPSGATGPSGALGPAGPQGAAGANATALGFATAKRALAVKAGRRVRVQYLTTEAARLTGRLSRGRAVVLRVARSARQGLNTLAFTPSRRLAPGRYTLALEAVAGGRRATATLALTVRRP